MSIRSLAQAIAGSLDAALHKRNHAVLCVSGGKSPVEWFEVLRKMDIDWSSVVITLADERCVPRSHPHSNAMLVETHLLKDLAASARFVPMIEEACAPLPSPQILARAAAVAIQNAGIADVMVLGMGNDGHTASLFPDDRNLSVALDAANQEVCVATDLPDPPANAPYQRITQTLAQILSSREIFLPVAGDEKLKTLELARHHKSPDLPVSYVLNQDQTAVRLWLQT